MVSKTVCFVLYAIVTTGSLAQDESFENDEKEETVWHSTSTEDFCRSGKQHNSNLQKMNFGDKNDIVELKLGDDTALIHLFGATVISWKTGKEQTENLFLSKTSSFDNKKAIRGGIPFVFPNFGPWSRGPQHGFARISIWSVSKKEAHKATFKLTETDLSLGMWPFKFELLYTVELTPNALLLRVDVKNTDTQEWDFTLLLHSYLRVNDIASTTISGLDKLFYNDKILKTNDTQQGELKITEAIDRVYHSTDAVTITDGCRTIVVDKQGLPEAVVWNPWIEGSAKTGDLDNDAWKHMVCVEPGKVAERVDLKAGELYIAKASIRIQN